MMYNPRTNRIECPTCHIAMRPFGGRLTPGFADLPEVFLCVGCGYNEDLNRAIGEALNMRALIKRRAESARRYVEAGGYANGNGNGHTIQKVSLRQRMIKGIIHVLERQID